MKTNGILYTFVKFNAVIALLLFIQPSFAHHKSITSTLAKDTAAQPATFASLNYTDIPNTISDIDDDGNPIARTATGRRNIEANGPKIVFKSTSYSYPQNTTKEIGANNYSEEQLLLYAKALKQFAIKFGYDTTYAFLTNMGMLSNKRRFFVVNLTSMKVEYSGLVSHGRGESESIYDKQYSNKAGSRATALGKYRIAGNYNGSYGDSYKVHGLEVSNSNAYNRNIVLHAMGCIPDIEGVAPACVSDGCPAVSKRFLAYLHKIIDTRKQSVLLWIFDSNLEEAVVVNSVPAPAPAAEPETVPIPPMSSWAKSK